MKIRKLSQVRKNICGVLCWKDINKDIARKQIKRCIKNLKNEEEVLEYCSEHLSKDMPLDKPLWEFHILEDYSKDTSIVIPKLHHSFTDGIGYVSLMSCVSDNKFIAKDIKSIPKQSIFQSIFLTLASPYYAYKLLFAAKKLRTDPQAAKIREMKNKDDMFVNLYSSKLFDFESIRKCYKRFPNTSFNDYVLGLISTSMNKWYKENGIEGAKNLKMVMPINTRNLPTCLNDLILDNSIMTFHHMLPIENDMEESIKKSKTALRKSMKPEYVLGAAKLGFILQFIPHYFLRKYILNDNFKEIDMISSNFSFSSVPFTFVSKQQLSVYPFSNLIQSINILLMSMTYKNQLRFTMMARRSMSLDPKKLLKILEDKLTSEIDSYAKVD